MNHNYALHMIGLPHTETTSDFPSCAFTANIIKGCKMFDSLGYKIYLYGGVENEAPCTEVISCHGAVDHNPDTYTRASWNAEDPHWLQFNVKVIEEVRKRIKPNDIILLIGGDTQKVIYQTFENDGYLCCEWAIGYACPGTRYKVFASRSQQHLVYGAQGGSYYSDVRSYDTVINHPIDPGDFECAKDREPYALYMGRLIRRKGVETAIAATERMGVRLVIAGTAGDYILPDSKYIEYVGPVGARQRRELMAHARISFMPSLMLEPFGMVCVENIASGTPILTTNAGSFPELVRQGKDGYCCDILRDFVSKAEDCWDWNYEKRKAMRAYAVDRWGMNQIRHEYSRYFDLLQTLCLPRNGCWGYYAL